MSTRKVLLDVRDRVMTVTLNRPAKLNAIDNDLARELLDAIARAAGDDDVRVLTLRGAGRAFCAGRDVGAAPTDRDLELSRASPRRWWRCPSRWWPRYTDGPSAPDWSGCSMPTSSSRRKAAASAAQAALGVFVAGGLTATLPAFAGLARAKGLILLGDESRRRGAGLGAGLASGRRCRSRIGRPSDEPASRQARAGRRGPLQAGAQRGGAGHFERAVAAENAAQRALQG